MVSNGFNMLSQLVGHQILSANTAENTKQFVKVISQLVPGRVLFEILVGINIDILAAILSS